MKGFKALAYIGVAWLDDLGDFETEEEAKEELSQSCKDQSEEINLAPEILSWQENFWANSQIVPCHSLDEKIELIAKHEYKELTEEKFVGLYVDHVFDPYGDGGAVDDEFKRIQNLEGEQKHGN